MDKKRHKVALILEALGKGGTEAYVAQLLTYLQRNSYCVEVVVLSQTTDENTFWNIPVKAVNLIGLPFFLRRNSFDICHLHLYANLLPATIGAKCARIPVVTTIHMPICSWGLKHRFYTRSAMALADRVVGVSMDALGGERGANIYPQPIPAPVASEFLGIQRERQPGGDLKILSVGRLAKEKNLDVLLRAMGKAVYRLRTRAVLAHFGEGPLRHELIELAEELGVTVEWNGIQQRSEIARALSTADVFVLPSKFEGSPLAAIEAMAIGVPTILSSFSSAQELVKDRLTGHIFPIGDADALADLLVWHSENPDLSTEIGMRGRAFALENFSEEQCLGHYVRIYSDLLA